MGSSHFLEPNSEKCQTCIFRSADEGGTVLHPKRMAQITQYLCQGTQHICHTNPDDLRSAFGHRACRGGRDLQLQVFAALGVIDAATDEALEVANQAYLASEAE